MTKSNARFRSVINLHFINHLSMYIYLKSMRLWGQDTLFSPFTECSEYRLSLVAQTINNLSVNARDLSSILGWEDSLEKKMATHSSILAQEIPRTEKPGGLQSMGSQRVGHGWQHRHLPRLQKHQKLLRTNTKTPGALQPADEKPRLNFPAESS